MQATSNQKSDLREAFEEFIITLRVFIVSQLDPKNPGQWEVQFRNALSKDKETKMQSSWDYEKSNHSDPINAIDFSHLERIAKNRSDVFSPFFGNNTKYLPNWFNEIYRIRNLFNHYNPELSQGEVNVAWTHMEGIAKCLKKTGLENKLKNIKEKRQKSEGDPITSVKKSSYFYLFISIGTIAIFIWLYFVVKDKPEIINGPPPGGAVTVLDSGNGKKDSTPPVHVHVEPAVKKVIAEDYSKYLNTASINSVEQTEVAVTIIDEETHNLESDVSSRIANIYNKTGKKGISNLLRSPFIRKPELNELFEGNSDIIEKLKLNHHTDYLALGKMTYSIDPGTLANGTFICNISLTMSIISTADNTLRNFTVKGGGNDVSESRAKDAAVDNLLYNFNSNKENTSL
jgi:hypothetical protein